jgi:16S rRNA G966 N2-methylase RsmD
MLTTNRREFLRNLVDIKSIPYNKTYNKVAKLHKYWSRKPWHLIENTILKFSKEGDVVLDPFMGSGTSGLECILNNRTYIGYDLNPTACFVSKLTLNDLNFDHLKFQKEIDQLRVELYEKIMTLYHIGNERYILYYISGDSSNYSYNTVTVDATLKNQEKITLQSNTLNQEFEIDLYYPDQEFPKKFYKDRFSYKGYKNVSDFYSSRNLKALTIIYDHITNSKYQYKDLFLLAFSNTLLHGSKLKGINVRPLGVNNYWIPDDHIQENIIWRYLDRVKNLFEAKNVLKKRYIEKRITASTFTLLNKSSLDLEDIKSDSIDYIITDPPYGDTIQYSELSFIWNCWLEQSLDVSQEVIINPVQNKGANEFHEAIKRFIINSKRVLKSNSHFTLCFQNKDISIWYKILRVIYEEGFTLKEVKVYDTFGNPFNKNWAKFSPKSDLYVTFTKSEINNRINASNEEITINEIIDDIKNILREDEKLLDLNKGYDLFVASIIHHIFEGAIIKEADKLNLKKVISLFTVELNNGSQQRAHNKNIQTELQF